MRGLTQNQKQVYSFITDCIRENGWPPTRREIADRFNWSSANAAQDVLDALEAKGAIRLGRGGARRIAINTAYEEPCV